MSGDRLRLAPRWNTAAGRAFAATLAAAEPTADAVIHHARNTLWRTEALGEAVVVKRFQTGGNRWKRFIEGRGHGKALRTFAIARALRARGVVTPEPLCALERVEGGRVTAAFYICAAAPAAGTVRDLVQRADLPDRLAHVRRFGAWAARLHDAGVLHRDFNAANVLLLPRADGAFDHALVDLNRIVLRRVGAAAGLWNLLQPGFHDDATATALLDGYCAARRERLGELDRLAYGLLARIHLARWAVKKATRPWRRKLGF